MTTAPEFYPSGEIKGLTDRPRLVRLGKIRLGVRKMSAKGNEYPQAVDFFVCPPEVTAIYGEKPRELSIMFPTDVVPEFAPVSYKMYAAVRGKICTSDGERAVRIVDDDVLGDNPAPTQAQFDRAIVKKDSANWSRRVIPCPNSECRFFQDNQCKPVMNLQFVVLGVKRTGVYQLDTSSINSIRDVLGGVQLIRNATGGRIAGIPLKLRIKPTTVYPEGKIKTVQTLDVIANEEIRDLAALGEKSLHDVLLPITEGRRPPEPAEPEEDLFPADAITVAAHPAGVAQSPRPVSPASEERGPTSSEVAGSSPAPRSDETMETALDAAARVEELFGQLGTPENERAMFRKGFRGKEPALIAMLEKNVAARKAKA